MVPLVSVVIPAYNSQETLSRCVESALADACKSIEIIVVDDGSIDGTVEVSKGLAERHPDIIRVITQSNRGGSAARNVGLRAALGEFIQFLDSDDELCNGKLAHSIAAFKADPNLICVYSDGAIVAGEKELGAFTANHLHVQQLVSRSSSVFTCALNTNLPIWRRGFLLDGGHFWCEDLPCWQEGEYYVRLLTSIVNSDRVLHIPIVGVRFNRSKSSSGISSTYWTARYILGQRSALMKISETCHAIGMWSEGQSYQLSNYYRSLLVRSVVGDQPEAWLVLAQDLRSDEKLKWRIFARLPFGVVRLLYRLKRHVNTIVKRS